MKIVFMGTPDFSVPCLTALKNEGHDIAAVFTQPDKPVGRKQLLTPPPVKVKAAEMGIKIYQPNTLRDGTAFDILKDCNPDVIVVVAYGKILPREILDLPKYGCINVHASLLPRHRGASPIQWAIVCGDSVSGVTTMKMADGIDTGDMLEKTEIVIEDDDTAQTLHDKLSSAGAQLIVSTLENIENITPQKQNDENATHAPIIKREMGALDFSKPAKDLHNLVRGFYPWPAAYTHSGGKRLKIYKTALSDVKMTAGDAVIKDGRLYIGCATGALEILELQLEGKSRMNAADFIKGRQDLKID